MMDFLQRLGHERLIIDGAMGTMLQNKGLAAGEPPELWNIVNAGAVLDIHTAYAQVGCHILTANTFGANRLKLSGTGYTVEQVVSAGVELARKVAESAGAYVALDVGPTGKLLAPFGDLDFEEAVCLFSETITAGARADLVLIETMGDTYEIKASMLAAKESCSLPVLVSFTLDESGRLLTGGDILTAVTLIEALGADALGLNCGHGPERMKALLDELLKYVSIPVIICPNAGLPTQMNGKTVFHTSPDAFAAHMKEIAAGAQLIGGCCGTTPEHIAAMAEVCVDVPFAKPSPKNYTAVSSYGKTVVFEDKTILIGERLNPTGKPRMKRALQDGDMEYLYREGLSQTEKGAQILDVNVGIPGIDEQDVLARVVTGLQSVTDTVLQIDTADAAAAERALRLYNGKPLLNSVNGKKESLGTILPLVKKYGAAVVALALDDAGIPETASGRLRVVESIVSTAEEYGIPQKNIIADALTMTISSGKNQAEITLEAMEKIRDTLGLHTVLGVSNISFGLPDRERLNAAFFTLAMSRGMSAGIVNPMSDAMMDALSVYQALSGVDKNCVEYMGRFSGIKAVQSPALSVSLYDAVVSGLREHAAETARTMVADTWPLEIINSHLIPALDKVGKDFEANKLYLPQLLMAAEAAKAAFEAVKLYMSKQGQEQKKRGKIVLATVKGDIHDIGKNIVKTLLENYNFQVIDIGKNVPPSVVVETVLRENAKLVGLSALMTTTVVYMEETIRLLKERLPDCRVMVGGAVLTQEYADQIGADFYSKDAMGGVRYADELFGSNKG